MTTRELIEAEIAKVPNEELDALFRLVRDFIARRDQPGVGIMARLRSVEIEGPPDFAENLDRYLEEERRGKDPS